MFPEKRRKMIVNLLLENESISVKELCSTLKASEATIRRDLSLLEEEGKIKRTHGGATLEHTETISEEPTFFQKQSRASEEKRNIAKKAFELIENKDSIVLDAGTTTLELAKLIGQSDLEITVITNATTAVAEIAKNKNVDLISIGGNIRLNTLATVGTTAVDNLRKFNATKAFIGINGISLEKGITTPDLIEAEVKSTMLQIAKTKIVLADHRKFNKLALCKVSPISEIDKIVTDNQLEALVLEDYLRAGIEIL